ncbi:hypothetical protein SpCBS45565_g01852 [Spizellomyces sp. 'palustris']|nr:hypothetical protein SpCBS45565_g01852 [Spizellomyces sp. 'palustris']
MKGPDQSPTVPDILALFDTFPIPSQLDLIELLMRKAAAQSPAQHDGKTVDEAWGRISGVLEQAHRGRGGQSIRTRSRTPPARAEKEGQISMRIPEELRPFVENFNILQKKEATMLFAGLEVTAALTSRHTRQSFQSNERARSDQPFALIESQLLTILLHAPAIILRPHPATSVTSTPAYTQYGQTSYEPHHHRSPSHDRIDHRSALAQVLSASSALAALIEAVVSTHNDRILAEMNDQGELEDYQRISEQVWETASGILRDVKSLKEGDVGRDSLEKAKALYGRLISTSMQFTRTLNAFVDFAWKILGSDSRRWPLRTDSAISFLSPNDVSPADRSTEDLPSTRVLGSPLADRISKRLSFGARLKRRLAQLTEHARPSSMSSDTSDDASESSHPTTRFSRPSEATDDSGLKTSSTRPTSLDVPRRGKSVDIPRQPRTRGTQYPVGRSSLDALRPKLRSRSSGDMSRDKLEPAPSTLRRSISARHSSSLGVPVLPEISFGTAKATEWLNEVLRNDEEESAGCRISSPEHEPENPPNHEIQASEGRAPPTVPHRHRFPHHHHSRSLSASTPIIPPLTTPAKRPTHSRTHSSSSLPSTRVQLLQAEDWKVRLPTDAGESYEGGHSDRWSRMMESVVGVAEGETGENCRQEWKDGMEKKPGLAVDVGKVDDGADGKNRFESLRKLGFKAAQRIPTYDSQGNRIGILDHGRFLSGTDEAGDANATEFISVRGNLLHLSEDDRDVLVMEMLNGKLQIVAGTMEKLVLRLADENGQDMDYVDMFIQTHPFYLSSRDLLSNLIMRYYCEVPEDASTEELEYFAKWQRPIRTKVLSVLARWVKLRFEDFEGDGKLREGFEDFLAEIESGGDSFQTEVERIRRVAAVQAMSICARTKQAPFSAHVRIEQSSSNPFPTHISQPLAESSPLLMFEAKDVARYLTLADARAFRSITMCDFVGKLGRGSSSSGRIDWFAGRANMIRNWVALELCTLFPRKPRRKLLEKFIAVAWYCRTQRNFHTSLFILSGLHSPAVQRLKKTWDGLSSSTLEKMRALERLMDLSGNMRELRRAVEEETEGGVVPFLPVVMKDATFVVEGNPEFIAPTILHPTDASQSSSQEAGNDNDRASSDPTLINFDKYRTLTRILGRYMSSVRSHMWIDPTSPAEGLQIITNVVESRLRFADDEGIGRGEGYCMRWAWECSGRCAGEDE